MKVWRVYFNRAVEAPQVWSIDQGDQTSEINVQGVRFTLGVVAVTKFDPHVRLNNTTAPRGWIEVLAHDMFLDVDGWAVFR